MNLQFREYQIQLLNTHNPDAFFELMHRNETRLADFFAGTIRHTKTLEETAAYCQLIAQRIEAKSYFPYIISRQDNGAYIGLVDVKNIDWNIPKAELGYFIDHQYEGKGITVTAVKLVIGSIVEKYQFKKLLCRVGAENIGSAKIAERNGFRLEGTIRRDYKTTAGRIVDLNYYGRLFD